ncbi:MAG: elongation factor P [Chloroflexi bacterium]|nr:elongation factor P [Chloroflexota bacterium]
MIDAGELRRGWVLRIDGALCQVVDFQHQKIGRGSANVRLRVRDVRSGSTTDRSFQASKRFERVILDTHKVQYLYQDASGYHFMDMETYEDMTLSADAVGDSADYLTDGLDLEITSFEGAPLGVELPINVDIEVVETEPGIRGDTATGATKMARVATGLEVQVPLFVETGDILRIDSRSGEYQTRV